MKIIYTKEFEKNLEKVRDRGLQMKIKKVERDGCKDE